MATSTINAIPTHTQANSYVTVAEADQYFSDRLASGDWTGASDDEKAQALLEATRRIDSFRFFEEKYRTTPEQALEFPRCDSDVITGSVDSGSDTTIVDDTLASREEYPDDYFVGWAVELRSGDRVYEIALVTDFAKSTGTLTFSALTGAVAAGDSYRLIQEVPPLIKMAVYETAIWLAGGGEAEGDADPMVKQHSIGKFSETFVDGHGNEVRLPKKALAYIRKYVSRLGNIM